MILDYDVFRFHSFDLFRYLLLDKSNFMKIDPIFLPMIKNRWPIAEQVDFYRSTCSSINPFDNFLHTNGKIHFNELDQYVNQMLDDQQAKSSLTQLGDTLYTALCSVQLVTRVIRYRSDKTEPSCLKDVKNVTIDKVDEMFRPKDIASYIINYRINAIILSSIDLAILVSAELISRQYLEPMTIMVCNYRYNYAETQINGQPIKVLNHALEITSLIDNFQYEFCTIDPYTGLSYNKYILNRSKEKGT